MLLNILWVGVTNIAKIYSYSPNRYFQSTEHLEKFLIDLRVENIKDLFGMLHKKLSYNEFNGHIFCYLRNSAELFLFFKVKVLFSKCLNDKINFSTFNL